MEIRSRRFGSDAVVQKSSNKIKDSKINSELR